MNKIEIDNFNLKETLDSGQFFLYYLINDFYYIVHLDTIFKVKQEGDFIFYDNILEEDLISFFNLNVDYYEIYDTFNDEYLLEALNKYKGLRIIKQDFWQCLVGFVCSSCSNIPKIKKNLELISKFFGSKVIYDDMTFYTFPSVGNLIDLDKLIEAKTGYRAKYLYEINKILKDKSLIDKIKILDYLESKKELMNFPGIGSKVADCICLFSLGHLEVFPIDVWTKRVVEDLYLKKESNTKEIEKFIKNHFKNNLGIKQQYLYHYIRNN